MFPSERSERQSLLRKASSLTCPPLHVKFLFESFMLNKQYAQIWLFIYLTLIFCPVKSIHFRTNF